MIDRRHIGRTWPPFEVEVEAGRLRLFAKAIGETGAIHTDVAAARAQGFRSIVAPPTFAAALVFDSAEPTGYIGDLDIPIGRILHGEQRVTYHQPICAGDRIRLTRTVVDIYERKGGALEFIVFRIDLDDATTRQRLVDLETVVAIVRQPRP